MDLNCNVPKQFYNKNNSFIPLSVCASPLLSSSNNNNKNNSNNKAEFLQIASSSSINSTGTTASIESSSGSSSGGFRPTGANKGGLGGISVGGGGCKKRLSAPIAVPATQCMPLPLMLMDISKQMSASCSAYQQHPWR